MRKRVNLLLTLSALALLLAGQAWGQTPENTLTLGSTSSAPRADSTSNYVDWWLVRPVPTTLINIFGYNSGAQQYVQLFDSAVGPTVSVTAWDATTDCFTNAAHGLTTGQCIQLTGTVATIAAGIYYVRTVDANSFSIYDTLAHAQTGGATGKQDIVGASSTATLNLLPIHVLVIAAGDNFSMIVPGTGMTFGHGLVIANSTTAATYTAGAKNLTISCTLSVP